MSASDSEGADATLQGLGPVIDAKTRLVVLGSFPGVASLRAQQYYGHPRNHFWPLMSALWGRELTAMPYADKLAALREHRVGLWDVYASCRREGSLDSAIEDAVQNDLASLLTMAPGLRGIAHNGGESARSMRITEQLGLPVIKLPSTSPANASWSFSRKLAAWRAVFIAVGVPVARSAGAEAVASSVIAPVGKRT
ncbi:DNA-deoxyinosine glycosylase [soil metagenome]